MDRLPRLCVTAVAPTFAAPRVTVALLSCSTVFPSNKAESLVMARLPPLSRTRPVPRARSDCASIVPARIFTSPLKGLFAPDSTKVPPLTFWSEPAPQS